MSEEETEEQEQPEECQSCNYETAALERYSFPAREDVWLCELCAGSLAGNAYMHPVVYRNHDVLATICYVGNVLLDAIRRQQQGG